MARRFKLLDKASKLPKSALDQYKKYKQGTVTLTRSGETKPGDEVLVYLNPFGLPFEDDGVLPVLMGSTTKTAVIALAGNLTLFNVKETTTSELAQFNPAFTPAKAIITSVSTSAPTTEKSDITGLNYKKYANISRTCPFGRKTATTDYLEIIKLIKAGIEKKEGGKNRVSFKPEAWSVY